MIRRLWSGFWLLVLLTGIPIGLIRWVGSPFPDQWPTGEQWAQYAEQPLTEGSIIGTLAVAVWLLWAALSYAVVADAMARLRRGVRWLRRLPQLPLPTPLQGLAGGMLGAAMFTTATPTTLTPPPTPSTATATVDTSSVVGQRADLLARVAAISPTSAAGRDGSQTPEWARGAPGGVHHVRAGDSLWDIADAKLGDPRRWREIYALNRGKPQPNGYALRDPDQIHVGWWLALPTSPGHTPAPPPKAVPAPPADPRPDPSHTASAPPPTPSPPPTALGATANGGSQPAAPRERTSARTGTETGVSLPSRAWVTLGLATMIAATALLVRLRHRRRAHLTTPIPIRTDPSPNPVPDSLRAADAAGACLLDMHPQDSHVPGVMPAPSKVPAPIGVTAKGEQVSLFQLPGAGVAVHGDGAPAAARAVVAAVLSTGVIPEQAAKCTVVTTADTLAQLLPTGVEPAGLDPHHEGFAPDDRFVILVDTLAAITHLEEEMIQRRRILDALEAATVAELNARTDHAEYQQPYVLLLAAADAARYAPRIMAVVAHRVTLHIHPVILGALEPLPCYDVAADGTVQDASPDDPAQLTGGRWSTLTDADLMDTLNLLRQSLPRPELGIDLDQQQAETDPAIIAAANAAALVQIPAATSEETPPVRLTVLGPITVATAAGTITTGVRTGSYSVLALLAAHPAGRTLEQIAGILHPDTAPATAVQRVRTDINAARSTLRKATGISGRGNFITYNNADQRYRIDPDLFSVDLWQMLAAIDHANRSENDKTCLDALRDATGLYQGDLAAGQDWAADHATTYRHQILNVYARIAEILESDHPDQAVAALEKAIEYDPVNEELYQRIIRIHGRRGRPDAVRRTLQLLEARYFDLGEAEPSEATRHIAQRQLPSQHIGALAPKLSSPEL